MPAKPPASLICFCERKFKKKRKGDSNPGAREIA